MSEGAATVLVRMVLSSRLKSRLNHTVMVPQPKSNHRNWNFDGPSDSMVRPRFLVNWLWELKVCPLEVEEKSLSMLSSFNTWISTTLEKFIQKCQDWGGSAVALPNLCRTFAHSQIWGPLRHQNITSDDHFQIISLCIHYPGWKLSFSTMIWA